MYKFTEKVNNVQKQTAYVLYMILGSYFHRSVCENEALETTLFLHYRDMPVKRQEQLEEKVIRDADKALENVRDVLCEMNCDAVLVPQKEEFALRFETGFETVQAVVDRKGCYRIQVR